MPRIFDNIELPLLPALEDTLKISERADFCVGYFNLRGWRRIDSLVENWAGGDGSCVRLMVGMQKLPQDELREDFSFASGRDGLDQQAVLNLKKRMAEEFRLQLTLGAPTNQDEVGLRRLSAQIRCIRIFGEFWLGLRDTQTGDTSSSKASFSIICSVSTSWRKRLRSASSAFS